MHRICAQRAGQVGAQARPWGDCDHTPDAVGAHGLERVEADRPQAEDRHVVARLERQATDAAIAGRQRVNRGAVGIAQVRWQGVEDFGRRQHILGEGAVDVDADLGDSLTPALLAPPAGRAFATADHQANRHAVALAPAMHA
jgi:hypothetical protein